MDLKTWDVLCLEAVRYKVACFACFACFSNLGFHFNVWWCMGDILISHDPQIKIMKTETKLIQLFASK